jgi:5-formyltetrahydrofolate cyclo-ligase
VRSLEEDLHDSEGGEDRDRHHRGVVEHGTIPKVMGIGADSPADKAAWRSELRSRLAALDARTARVAADRIGEQALALPEVATAAGVVACLSFGAEVSTTGLVHRLVDQGRRVFVPRVAPGDPLLHLHPYPCRLETLSFGLRQPVAGEPELVAADVDSAVEVALLVGLGFDRRGYRLGYGRGFFDRFLAARPFSAIGLAYDLQLVDRLPVDVHDVPMRAVVTEREVCRPDGDDGTGGSRD